VETVVSVVRLSFFFCSLLLVRPLLLMVVLRLHVDPNRLASQQEGW
jgi:hypothetical protein